MSFVGFVVAAVFGVGGLFFSWKCAQYVMAARARKDWPVVDGVVTSATLTSWAEQDREMVGRTTQMHSIEVCYEYDVASAAGYRTTGSKKYIGAVPMGASTNPSTWSKKLAEFEVGTKLRVFYDPNEPKVSTLDPAADVRGGVIGVGIGFVFSLLAVAMGYAISRMVSP